MLTPYARRLLSRNAATVSAVEDADGWKPISGSGMLKPAVRLAFAPRKSGAVWIVRNRGRQVFESPDKAEAIAYRDALRECFYLASSHMSIGAEMIEEEALFSQKLLTT